eukprot:687147-Pyramimonas_sp.AAC.1
MVVVSGAFFCFGGALGDRVHRYRYPIRSWAADIHAIRGKATLRAAAPCLERVGAHSCWGNLKHQRRR